HNLLELPQQTTQKEPVIVELWYRVYCPDEAENGSEQSLPKLGAHRFSTGETVALPTPKKRSPFLLAALGNMPPKPTDAQIHLYSCRTSNLYANRDAQSLAAQLDFSRGPVALLCFKAPPLDTRARYWSISLGGISTRTSATVADQDVTQTADGY